MENLKAPLVLANYEMFDLRQMKILPLGQFHWRPWRNVDDSESIHMKGPDTVWYAWGKRISDAYAWVAHSHERQRGGYVDATFYRQIVGNLLCLVNTHPYSCQNLKLLTLKLQITFSARSYLKGIEDMGIFFKRYHHTKNIFKLGWRL